MLQERIDLFITALYQTGFDTRYFFIVVVLGKGEVGYEPRLVPSWTMLAIGSLGAM